MKVEQKEITGMNGNRTKEIRREEDNRIGRKIRNRKGIGIKE